MTQAGPKRELFGARFRVTWPYWAGGYPDQHKALQAYQAHQASLRTDLARKLSEKLGSEVSLADISHRPFEPVGIELSFTVEGPSSADQIDALLVENVVRELSLLVRSFFQAHMPGGPKGANLYLVESEVWAPGGWLRKVESLHAPGETRKRGSGVSDFEPTTTATRTFESPQMATITDQELEELLTALAKKHLRPQALTSRGPALGENVERLLSTRRFLQVASERPENAELYRTLGKEIETAPARPILDSLRDLGILDALDDAPALVFTNLRRSAIPPEDVDLFRLGGIGAPEAEVTILLYRARDFAPGGQSPSEAFEEAAQVLRRKGEEMRVSQDNTPPPKKRKIFNGIGNLLMGLATAGGNGLLAAGTIVAPNPATGYVVIGSAAMAAGAVFKGLGDLRGE